MFTNGWTTFSEQEIGDMSTYAKVNPKPLEDNSERKCPSCGRHSIRSYYREGRVGTGTSWFWCYKCQKSIHYRVAPLSEEYIFNDPIADVPQKGSYKWYEYLNSLWDKGILPQVFKKRINKT